MTETRKAGEAAAAEGRLFGAGRKEMDCVSTALQRDRAAGGLVAHVHADLFMAGCLDASLRSPEFCADIPDETDLLRSTRWRVGLCRAWGRSDPFCDSFVATIQRHCHPPAKKA